MADGKDYIATVELTDASGVVAAVGQTCEDVAPESLGWLIAQGLIVPAAQSGSAETPTESEEG